MAAPMFPESVSLSCVASPKKYSWLRILVDQLMLYKAKLYQGMRHCTKKIRFSPIMVEFCYDLVLVWTVAHRLWKINPATISLSRKVDNTEKTDTHYKKFKHIVKNDLQSIVGLDGFSWSLPWTFMSAAAMLSSGEKKKNGLMNHCLYRRFSRYLW